MRNWTMAAVVLLILVVGTITASALGHLTESLGQVTPLLEFVLLGFLAGTIAVVGVRASVPSEQTQEAPAKQESAFKSFEFQYGLVFLRTKRFQSHMDRLARHRISKPVGWFFLYVMPVAAAIGLYIFLPELTVFFSPVRPEVGTAIRSLTPLVYLGLPGINPYLPWLDGWIALIVAMVIHEGAHGVVARSLGLPVKSSGLLLFLILPIGAFVEVDEDAVKIAKARDSARMLAAGAGINFVVGVVALLILFAVVATMTPMANGLAVSQVAVSSPAATAGIKPGDFIKQINGVAYNNSAVVSEMEMNGSFRPGQVINLTLWRAGATIEIPGVKLAGNPSNKSMAYLGIVETGSAGLQALVSSYTGSFFTRPILYLCIPTFPQCQDLVPFSGSVSEFYTSPYGVSLVPLATLLYWFFFLNFNLAVFNSLPIYPLDGGQTFKILVQVLGRGRLSEKTVTRICIIIALFVLAAVFSVPLAAYLHLI
jgi:membrane-associated protease RseP (regulator of RpoE activity)